MKRTLSLVNVRVIALTFVPCLVIVGQSSPTPVLQKFVGLWMEDESKLKIGDSFGKLRFRQSSDGLEELRGPEVKPLVQSVKFGTKPYAINGSTNTIAWMQIDSSHFERSIFNEGKLQNTRRIEVSADGKALTEVTEVARPGEKKYQTTIAFQRISGGPQGLAGIWKAQSVKRVPAPTVRYELSGTDGLKVSEDFGGNVRQYSVKMDKVPVAVVGKTVVSGTMTAFRVVDDHTLEAIGSREGVVTGKETLVISGDGKMITSTSTTTGNQEPTIRVFNKQ
jgi:hypothetical protein